MRSVSSLEEVLKYSHPDVVERYQKQFPEHAEIAADIFREMLKMLWLMALHKEEARNQTITSPKKILVYSQMSLIDEMWHAFMLFSRDYTEFCENHFGYYLHHSPTTAQDRQKEKELENSAPEVVRAEIDAQCRYIVQKLGLSTLTSWFKTLAPQM